MFGFPTDLFGISNGQTHQTSNNALIPHQQNLFGQSMMMPSPFFGMSQIFNDFGLNTSPFSMMDKMMREAQQVAVNGPMQSFTSTTIMSYNGVDGQPKIYQESTSRRLGPGGVEETRQSVRDSERRINKMQVGHRIGDRKHVIEREMNAETGQISENVELENLEEEDTDEFQREWEQRTKCFTRNRHSQPTSQHQLSLQNSSYLHHQPYRSQYAPLAIEQTATRPTTATSMNATSSNANSSSSNRSNNYSSGRSVGRPTETARMTIKPNVSRQSDNDMDHQAASLKRKPSSSSSLNNMHNDRRYRSTRF